MTNRIVLLLTVLAVCGCSYPVEYTLSEDYQSARPVTVALMPVDGVTDDPEIRFLFRKVTLDKLVSMNYRVLPLEEVDEKYARLGSARISSMDPAELPAAFGVDGVLLVEITEWKEKIFIPYGALKIGARFKLYSRDGQKLWEAEYSTKESELAFDRGQMELSVIKTYEPRLQRVVDAIMGTLPMAGNLKRDKMYYDWL